MAVYQNDKGRWYYKFQIDGREFHRAAKGAKSQKDAEKIEARIKTDIYMGNYGFVEHKGNRLFEELEKIYSEYARVNKISWRAERCYVKSLLEYFRGKKLKEITPQMIEKYRFMRQSKGKKDGTPLKNATLNRETEILRKMFNIAIDNNWLDSNPCTSKKVPKLREDNVKERYLEKEEELRLLNACTGTREYIRTIILFALHTGMRKAEILNLKWEFVNLKQRYIILLKTKCGKPRNVPLSLTMVKELEKLYMNKTSEYVFVNPETGIQFFDIKKCFKFLCKQANIENLRFHDLRHTAATRMVASGVDLVTVQNILGHTNIITTSRYAHPVTEQKLIAVDALDKYNELI